MSDPYAEIKEHFSGVEEVIVNSGRGAQGMKVSTKMFAMFYKGDLVLNMPPDRVAELIAAGEGLPFDPGTGKFMKNRILIPAKMKNSWITLSEESAASM
ncbi:MAG: hypothetical protein HN757_05185 [Calditrichaeota bacterium]|nr:hypothetical protein [Calditrichota bacterium]